MELPHAFFCSEGMRKLIYFFPSPFVYRELEDSKAFDDFEVDIGDELIPVSMTCTRLAYR